MTSRVDAPFGCGVCYKRFPLAKSLLKHFEVYHPSKNIQQNKTSHEIITDIQSVETENSSQRMEPIDYETNGNE